MTTPSMIAFGYDQRGSTGEHDPKILVRTLLFSTGERGHVIDTLFAYVRHGDVEDVFPVWGYDADSSLVRGGGLFVSKTGVTAWHHFIALEGGRGLRFTSGTYEIEVRARIHGSRLPVTLWSTVVSIPEAAAPGRHDGSDQVWIDRDPQSDEWQPRLESRPTRRGQLLSAAPP